MVHVRSHSALLVVLFFGVAVSGCVDADEVQNVPQFTETTGSVAGKVLTENFEAIANASAELVSDGELIAQAPTDSDGRYALNEVEPGSYRIQFSASCCNVHVEAVLVEAGKATEIDALLRPAAKGQKIDEYEVVGMISCGARQPGSFAMNCPFADANTERQLILEADPGLKSIVVAMDWEPAGFALQPYLYHAIFTTLKNDEITGQNHAFEDAQAEPVLEYRLDADPSDPFLDWDGWDDPIPIEFRIGAGSDGGPNFIFQQRFTLHFHLFYDVHAPEDYSALP